MRYSEFLRKLKPWMLPLAMLCGLLFHNAIEAVAFFTPWLIFAMLFITFCRLEPKKMRITGLSLSLLAVQLGGAVAVYLALLPVSGDVAQGAFICVFCPTATAAPVITGMLGGNISRLATFSLVSNMAVAVTAPAAFTLMGTTEIDFAESVSTIALRVLPLILGPLVTALVLKGVAPSVHRRISSSQSIGFYLWAVSLIIVVGRAVSFVMKEPPSRIPELVALALVAGVVCIVQFVMRSQNRPTLWRPHCRCTRPRTEKHSSCHLDGPYLPQSRDISGSCRLYSVAKHHKLTSDISQTKKGELQT